MFLEVVTVAYGISKINTNTRKIMPFLEVITNPYIGIYSFASGVHIHNLSTENITHEISLLKDICIGIVTPIKIRLQFLVEHNYKHFY